MLHSLLKPRTRSIILILKYFLLDNLFNCLFCVNKSYYISIKPIYNQEIKSIYGGSRCFLLLYLVPFHPKRLPQMVPLSQSMSFDSQMEKMIPHNSCDFFAYPFATAVNEYSFKCNVFHHHSEIIAIIYEHLNKGPMYFTLKCPRLFVTL